MSHKRSFSTSILSVVKNKSERYYIWKHIWETNNGNIEKELEKKKLSITPDYSSGELVVTGFSSSIDTLFFAVNKIFQQLSDGITAVKIKSQQQMTDSEVNKLYEQLRSSEIGVYRDPDQYWLWFVGDTVLVDNILSHLKSTCFEPSLPNQELRQSINENVSSIENTFEHITVPFLISLNHDEQAIIWLNDLFNWRLLKSDLVLVEYDRFDIKISVFDSPKKDDIEKEIREKIESFRSSLAHKTVSFSSSTLEFILRREVHNYIQSRVTLSSKADVVWFKEDGKFLKIYARDFDTVDSKARTIKSLVIEDSFSVPAIVFKNSKVMEQLNAIEDSFNNRVEINLSTTATTINIRYTSDNSFVKGKIEDLFAVRQIFLLRDRQPKCRQFFKKLKQLLENKYVVELSEEDEYGNYKWILIGDNSVVRSLENKLGNLAKSISSRARTFITDESKQILLAKLHSIDEAGKCAIFSKDTVLHSESKDRIDLRDFIPCRTWALSCGTIVKLQKCNFKQNLWMPKDSLVVDIIPAREQVSEVVIQPVNGCFVATVCVPVWRDNINKEKEHLCEQVKSLQVMISADKSKFASLNFDLADVAKVKWPVQKYVKVILAVITRKHVKIPVHFHEPQKGMFEEITDVIEKSNTANRGIDKIRLKITVDEGELAKQTTDAIVNSAHKTLQLQTGAVSKTILRHAGKGIQDECDSFLSGRPEIKVTEVVVTNAYDLSCGMVFHGTLPLYIDDKQKILEKFVKNCLIEAEKLNMKTIAFPALGTGNLGYPADLVAKKMFDTVEKFASDNLVKSLSEVLFVIYPADANAVQAFKKEQTNRQNLRTAVTWKESRVTSPESIACTISVVGEDTQIVENTFKEISERLSKKERKQMTFLQLANEETFSENPNTSFAEPDEQKIDRDEKVEMITSTKHMSPSDSHHRPANLSTRETESDNTISYNTFAPDESLHRYAEKPQHEMCKIVFRILSDVENPYQFIMHILSRFNIKEDHIIWSEHNRLQARVKLECEEVADKLIGELKNEKNYEIEKCNPDAVCNIRAKLNKSMNSYLQTEVIRRNLEKQSGVGIVLEENGDGIILTGDLTEISFARDILLGMKKTNEQDDMATQRDTQLENNIVSSKKYSENSNAVNASNANKTSSYDNRIQTYSKKDNDPSNATIVQSESNTESQKRLLPQLHQYQEQSVQTNNAYSKFPKLDMTSNDKALDKATGAYSKGTKQSTQDSGHEFKFQSPPAGNSGTTPKPNISSRTNNVYAQEDSVMMITKEGIKVFVYKADICHLGGVDCIVNSTDSHMTNQYGVSNEIAKEAGDSMRNQCQVYLDIHKKLNHDKVCVTSGGKMLHYKKIIHVNAPKWNDGMKKKVFTESLSSAVTMCLLQASKATCVAVALPAISSGHGKAPIDAQFKAYSKGVIDFSRKEGKKTCIKDIHFVDIVQEVVDYVQAAFLFASPESEVKWKDKILNLPQRAIEIFKPHIRAEDQAGKHLEYFFPESKLVVIACDGGLLSSLKHSHVKNISETQGFGDWKYEDTGIVITEDIYLNGQSQSSKKCIERGGPTYKKNYSNFKKGEKKKEGIAVGILGDYDLEFNQVFCAVMPTVKQNIFKRNSIDQTNFFDSMNSCLQNLLVQAEKTDVKHLAMPVLGLDMYDIKEEWFLECCISNMMVKIKEFALSRKRKGFMIIHVVINGNEKVFQILHREMHDMNIGTRV